MIRKLLLASLAVLAVTSARAADLPLKALPFQYPTASGFFFGANASVDAGTATTVQGVASSALYGGDIGVSVGYTGKIGATFYFVEAMFDVSSVQAGSNSVDVLNVKRSADFEQRYAVGVPAAFVQQVLNLIPGLGGASMPTIGFSDAQVNPYVFASTHEQDVSFQLGNAVGKNWAFSWGFGAGNLYRVKNGLVWDTWIEYRNGSDAVVLGPAPVVLNAKFGNSVKVGVGIKL